MKKRKLKKYVLPTLVLSLSVLALTLSVVLTNNSNNLSPKERRYNYVSNIIISEEIPVIDTTPTKIINPYSDETVTIGKNYYDYKASSEEQEKSIIYHENTYIQNSGIDFVSEKQFEVLSVLDGTISNIKEDELLGRIIEINHNNEYVSIYQSLGEIKIKKGDVVSQGQVLGLSGTNKLDKELGNHLHFEFYASGQIVDPMLYLNKEISTKAE